MALSFFMVVYFRGIQECFAVSLDRKETKDQGSVASLGLSYPNFLERQKKVR
jgi:hypothetical protein